MGAPEAMRVDLTRPVNALGKCVAVVPMLGIAQFPIAAPAFPRQCTGCKEKIEPASDGYQRGARWWHFGCFACDVCWRPFGSMPFCEVEGLVMHQSCHAEIFSKRCFVCGGVLAGSEAVKALGLFMHTRCLKCSRCGRRIDSSEAFDNVDGLPLCHECFARETHACVRCGQELRAACERFLYQGRCYYVHKGKVCSECSECRTTLTQANFALCDGVPLCVRCWLKAMTRQCLACEGPIVSKDYASWQGDWHQRCFRCDACGSCCLYDKPTVCGSTLYCARCTDGLKAHCARCGRNVGEKDNGVQAHGRLFHPACMTCAKCRAPIGQAPEDSRFEHSLLLCRKCAKGGK